MDHSPLCPAFASPLAVLMGSQPGPCECGADRGAVATATAVKEPPAPPVVEPAAQPSAPDQTAREAPAAADQSAPTQSVPAKRQRKPRAKKADIQAPPVAPTAAAQVTPPTPEVPVAPSNTILESSAVLAPAAASLSGESEPPVTIVTGPATACADSTDPSPLPVPAEPATIVVPPEPAQNFCFMCLGQRDIAPDVELCSGCGGKPKDPVPVELPKALAQPTAPPTPAPESSATPPAPSAPEPSATPPTEPSADTPAPEAPKKRERKPRSKKTPDSSVAEGQAAPETPPPPPLGHGTDAPPVKTAKEVAEAAKSVVGEKPYVQVVLDGVNLKPMGSDEAPKIPRLDVKIQVEDLPKPAGPKLSDAEKAALLEAIRKQTCAGCREGLLFADVVGTGMEPVISTGGPGELAYAPITSPDQGGEKWHLACLQQKVQIEKEGRLKVNPKDGTYEILSAPIKPTDEIRSIPRQQTIDSSGAALGPAPKDDLAAEAEIAKARVNYEQAGMAIGASSDSAPTKIDVAPPSGRRRLFVGIDPDIHGYLCLYNALGAIVRLVPMPVAGSKEKPVYDEHGMVREARLWKEMGVELVLIEQQQALGKFKRGGKEVNIGSIANFKKGLSFGLWRGILAALGIRFDTVRPATWKSDMGITVKGGDPKQAKGKAVTRTQSLHPELDLRDWERSPKARVPDPAKAEAVLLSRYVMLRETGGLEAMKADAGLEETPPPAPAPASAPSGPVSPPPSVDVAPSTPASPPPVDVVPPVASVPPAAIALPPEESAASEPSPAAPTEISTPSTKKPRNKKTTTKPEAAAPSAPPASQDESAWLRNMTETMKEQAAKTMAKTPSSVPAGKKKPRVASTPKPSAPTRPKKPSSGKSTEEDKAMQRVLKSLGKG
jgi:hypothetical protein